MPKLRTRRRPVRPPRMRTIAKLPRGPRLYRIAPGSDFGSGPGEPPPGFLTYTNSRSEWVIYWAIAKILKYPVDPRKPPFIGYPGLWGYQTPFEGGRAVRGGQVIDFMIESPVTKYGALAIRIETERYHVFTDARKKAKDMILATRAARHVRIVDVREQDFMMSSSPSGGQAAIVQLKRVIFGGRGPNPLGGGARRLR